LNFFFDNAAAVHDKVIEHKNFVMHFTFKAVPLAIIHFLLFLEAN